MNSICRSPTFFQYAKVSQSAVFNESTPSWESALRTNAKSQIGIIERRGGIKCIPSHQKAVAKLCLPTEHWSTWALNDAVAATHTLSVEGERLLSKWPSRNDKITNTGHVPGSKLCVSHQSTNTFYWWACWCLVEGSPSLCCSIHHPLRHICHPRARWSARHEDPTDPSWGAKWYPSQNCSRRCH